MIPRDALLSGGWRISFVVSIVLLIVGFCVRNRIAETPVFQASQVQGHDSQSLPIVTVLRDHKRAVLTAMALHIGATKTAGFTSANVLVAILSTSAMEVFTLPALCALSDRVGRRPVYLLGACLAAAFAFRLLWRIDSGSFPLFLLAITFDYAVGLGAMFAVRPAYFSEFFGTEVKYTGIWLGYQLANIIGGLTPFSATALVASANGASWPVSVYLLAACLEQHPTEPNRFGRINLPCKQRDRALLPSRSAREVLW